MKSCFRCGTEWDGRTTPGYGATCLKCRAYWHCCMNCKYFEDYGRRCTNTDAGAVDDRESRNSCDEFMLRDRKANPLGDGPSGGEDRLKKLFGE
jgi:hypothetical protein